MIGSLKTTLFVFGFILMFYHGFAVNNKHPLNLKNKFDIKQWGEKALIRYLLEDYDHRSRPVVDGVTPPAKIDQNSSIEQITVEFGLGLIQILDLDEMEQVLTTSVRSLYRWTDYHLMWKPEDFDNISEVNIPTQKIWLPDIALYNYADERLEERRECDAKISYDGTVEWHPMAIYKSTCSVRIKFFPFDKQGCKMKFGAWTYDGFRVNITLYDNREDMDMDNYVKSPEWNILDTLAKYYEVKYPCCPEPYPDISFYIWIERQPAFYNYILILPCFLLSSLTLVLFWLPPETPAKMVLGMNIFVAFFLLLLLLEDSTPSASDSFPLIGTYYCLNMGLITLSTFLCLIVVNFHFRGDNRKEVPHWLKKLAIQHGARFLFVNLGANKEKKDPEEIPLRSGNNTTTPTRPLSGLGMGGIFPCTQDNNTGHWGGNPGNRSAGPVAVTGFVDDRYGMGGVYPVGGVGMPGMYGNPPVYPVYQSNPFHQQAGYPMSQGQISHQQMQGMGQSNYPQQHHQMDTGGVIPVDPMGSYNMMGDNTARKRQLMVVQDCDTQSSRTKPAGHQHSSMVDDGVSDCVRPTGRRGHRNANNTITSPGVGGSMPFRFELLNADPLDPQTARRINMVTKDVNDIVKGLRYMHKKNENKERVNKVVAEWRAVGMVLDRLFFVCYVFTIVLSIILFFPKAGNDVTVGDPSSVL